MKKKAAKATIRDLLLILASTILGGTFFAQESKISTTLAPTPPMGWNSWNKFACNVSEDLIRQTADAMVKSGMKDAGYQYVVIDDC
jgi:alpha-galactosidase